MRRLFAFVALLAVVVVPRADGAELQLPNLQPAKPFDIQLGYADEFDFNQPYAALRFSMSSQNVGPYALDLLGAPPESETRTVANQCVAWLGKVCTERRAAGSFDFHATHGHWHLDSFAAYELRAVTKKGDVDMSPTGLVATSGKVSFCMMDSTTNAEPTTTDVPFYATCTGVYQGISSGWRDIYDYSLPGQQIVVKDVPDGVYALVVYSNYNSQLLETDYSDNTAFQKIRLTTTANTGCTTTRTVELV